MRMMQTMVLVGLAAALATGCGAHKHDAAKYNFVSAQMTQDRAVAEGLVQWLVNHPPKSPACEFEAHAGKPIVIDAARFQCNATTDFVTLAKAIFDSPAFKKDWGAIFPKETNGWDAFIATLQTVRSAVPWMAGAYAVGKLADRAGDRVGTCKGDNCGSTAGRDQQQQKVGATGDPGQGHEELTEIPEPAPTAPTAPAPGGGGGT